MRRLWNSPTRAVLVVELLSISPLRFLAAVAVVQMAAEWGRVSAGRVLILRCDNETMCTVLKQFTAYTLQMVEAL